MDKDGKVYNGINLQTGTMLAIKTLSKEFIQGIQFNSDRY